MPRSRGVLLVARREATMVVRSRAARGAFAVLLAVAWLPALLMGLRMGEVRLASFPEQIPLLLALGGVVLPLLALLAGTDLLAGEMESGTLASVVTLPISRTECFAGKALARASILCASYVSAFGVTGLAVASTRGVVGWQDYLAVGYAGLLLCLACGAIGAWVGASGRGRVRAYGSALLAWVFLALALDAILLAVVVAGSPAPPSEIGSHGHSEIRAPSAVPMHDPHAHGEGAVELSDDAPFPWLLAANPVDLFRLTAVASGPDLRARFQLGLPAARRPTLWVSLLVGWLFWLVVPTSLALRRFQSAVLR